MMLGNIAVAGYCLRLSWQSESIVSIDDALTFAQTQ